MKITEPTIGIAAIAVALVLCFTAVASDSTPTEKVSAVDATQYADFMANETMDMQDLAESAEDQRRFFDRITPPGFSWIQPMLPAVVPFNADNFDDNFLDELLGEDKNSVAIYPLSLVLDPKTRETLVYNADGKLIASVSADRDVLGWPDNADPARVTLRLDLLPTEDVEPYLYTESRITDSGVSKSAKAKSASMKSLGTSEFGIAGVQPMTNGSMRLTVSNGTDVAEVFAYTVLHTSATVVVTWTNEQSNVVTDTNTLWYPVSPPFNGIECAWESQTTNLLLTNGVGTWEDAGISSNARVRFYAAVKGGDADQDHLTNSEEIFVYHTNPDVTDTDGDGLPDGWEVQNGLDPLDADGNNGPEGDPDGDGFNNALEFELDAPANNPAWNGHELAYRLAHAHTVVVTNTRSITTNLIGMRVTVTNSWDCETGGHPGRQNNTDYLVVSNLLEPGYYIDITVTGSVEDVDDYYDEVTFEAFTNTFYFMSHDGVDDETEEEDCFMVDEGATRNNLILANSTVHLRYDTVGYKWHKNAFAEIIAATNTGVLKVDLDVDSDNDGDIDESDDSVEMNAPGVKVHVNDDFDEGQTIGSNLVSDNLQNPSSGQHQILYSDSDLKEATLTIEPAGLTGAINWTVPNALKVWWQQNGSWVEVSNITNYTSVAGPVGLRFEGITPTGGTVIVSFSPQPGSECSDETKFTVFTGLNIGGVNGATLRGQVEAAASYTLAGTAGDVWRTGGSQSPSAWASSFRNFVDPIFETSKVTSVDGVNTEPIIIGSYTLEELDTGDIGAVPEDRQRATILVHELVEQFNKQVNGLAYDPAHALGIAAEEIVTGGSNRTDTVTYPIPGTIHFRGVYDPGIVFEFDIISGQTTIQNVSVTR